MNTSRKVEIEAHRIERLFREKVSEEIAAANLLCSDEAAVSPWGDELAEIMLVKGEPGSEDRACGYALAGADGRAIGKALDALELHGGRFAVCSRVANTDVRECIRRLALIVEAVDPRIIIALDAAAAEDLTAVFEMEKLIPGLPVRVFGRTLLAVDDFEGSLGDDARKRRAWHQLQSLHQQSGP